MTRTLVSSKSLEPYDVGGLRLRLRRDAVLIELYSRKVVGSAMSERIDQQLVVDALNMAVLRCRPQPALTHRTD